jgi:hypothetical protein
MGNQATESSSLQLDFGLFIHGLFSSLQWHVEFESELS